jgi:predicted small lipoprotein YifL
MAAPAKSLETFGRRPGARLILAAHLACVAGCASIGPSTLPRDRFDYSQAITESWKRQNLLNIVKLRYLDPPTFVDVGQIVAGYTLETALTAGGTMVPEGAVRGDSVTLGAAARFTDRPTITYTPLTGNKFVKSLMTPIPPDSLFFTIESGWPADGVMLVAASVMNGLKNQQTSIAGVSPPTPEFLRAISLLRKIQLSGAVGLRVLQDESKRQTSVLTFRARDVPPETLEDILELRRLLKIDPDAKEIRLVFGGTAENERELAVQTRSMLHIMTTMASQVDVPPEHVAEGRATPGWVAQSPDDEKVRFLHVRCSESSPENAFAAVKYRDRWFWIDDRDLKSKRTLALMMLFFSLADSGEREPLPLITIPAQ